MDEWPAGTTVRIVGLAKTPQHNGRVGRVSARTAGEDGRVGVELGKGQTLSVRCQNLQQVEEPEPSAVDAPGPAAPEGVQRTLQRDNSVLQEFDGSAAPDTLALYHHLRDRAFDAFNAAEYNEQMLRYYAGGITVTEVVPRKMGQSDYVLVCLRNKVGAAVAAVVVVAVVDLVVPTYYYYHHYYQLLLRLLRSRSTTLCASWPSSASGSSVGSRCSSSVAASHVTGTQSE